MKQNIPAGLMAVHDLIEKHPTDRERLLSHELVRRERERLLFRGTRKLLHLHLWTSAKSILVLGVTVFVLVWTVGQVAQIAQWFQQVQNTTITIPVPLRNDFQWHLRDYLPTSTVLDVASKIPAFDWRDAAYIALALMILLLVEKIIIAFFSWKHASALKGGEVEAEEEIQILKEWLGKTSEEKSDTVIPL